MNSELVILNSRHNKLLKNVAYNFHNFKVIYEVFFIYLNIVDDDRRCRYYYDGKTFLQLLGCLFHCFELYHNYLFPTLYAYIGYAGGKH